MPIAAEQPEEPSLSERLETQKELVARLISEGKDATEANATLYELGKLLDKTLRKTGASSASQ
jgi:hypothetical protein